MTFAEKIQCGQNLTMPRTRTIPIGSGLDRQQIARRLTIIRESMGLSSSEMAYSISVDRTNYGNYEKGNRDLTLAVAWKIYRAHGFTLDFIYDGKIYGVPGAYREQIVSRIGDA